MAWANITPNAKTYVNDVLSRGWLSYSKYMPAFEQAVAKIHGAKYGILVNSGTDALRISLATLKEVHQWKDGDEVIVPAVTFVATVNAVLQNSLRVKFADVDLFSCNINTGTINSLIGPRTRAVIPVHLFGLPVTLPKIKLKVVEDSCETFGVHTIHGDLACFSFYVSHHVSTGVGGMILTNSHIYEKITRSTMNHGRIDDGTHFKFGRSGYSSRITEMEAALGIAALEHFDDDLIKRSKLAKAYYKGLEPIMGLHQPIYVNGHSWMFFPVLLKRGSRDALLKHLRKSGVESREAMPLINQPVFKSLYKPGSCPNAELWTANGILLPLHPQMSEKDVAYVCQKVKAFFA